MRERERERDCKDSGREKGERPRKVFFAPSFLCRALKTGSLRKFCFLPPESPHRPRTRAQTFARVKKVPRLSPPLRFLRAQFLPTPYRCLPLSHISTASARLSQYHAAARIRRAFLEFMRGSAATPARRARSKG